MAAPAEEFFAGLLRGFARACEKAEPLREEIAVGRSRLRLEFATERLRDYFMAALRHLRAPGGGCELTIHVWEGAEGPNRPEGWREVRDGIGLYRDARFTLHDQKDVGVLDMLDMLDAPDPMNGRAVVWVPELSALAPQEEAAPFIQLFQAWFRRKGLLIVHAGGVGSREGAALLVGRSGSGKSTTSAAARLAGMGYLGDDHCLLDVESLHVWSLYDMLKLTAKSRALLPQYGALKSAPVEPQKDMIFLHGLADGGVLHDAPLRVVLLPRVTGGSCKLRRATSAEAMRALGPSSLFQIAEPDATAWAMMARLVRALPCFHLELGGGVEAVPGLLREVLG